MRGQVDPQATMFHYFSADSRVPAEHPLRRIKKLTERALGAISGELDALYSTTGRPASGFWRRRQGTSAPTWPAHRRMW